MVGRDARIARGLGDDVQVVCTELGREVADDLKAILEGRRVQELSPTQISVTEAQGHRTANVDCDLTSHVRLHPTG